MYHENKTTAQELRKTKDRVIFLNEFAVAYEKPLESDPQRGYYAIYVTYDHTQSDNPTYEQEHYMSGDNGTILEHMSQIACEGSDYIEYILE